MPEVSKNFPPSRAFLTLQNSQDIPPLSPEISPHVHVENTPVYLNRFHQLTTYAGDQPYLHADIKLESIDSHANPEKIFLTQSYAQESRINNLVEFTSWLRYLGVDAFNLSGAVTVTDDQQEVIARLEPPVFEVFPNGDKKLISGHHRLLLAYLLGTPINSVTIRNFDEKLANPFEAIPLTQINISSNIPKDDQKRQLLPSRRYTEVIDPLEFSDESVRTSDEFFDRRFRPFKIEVSPKAENKDLLASIKKTFENHFKTPDFFDGIISGPETNPEYPEFASLQGVTDIGADKSEVNFNLIWSQNGRKTEKAFKIIAENPNFKSKYSVAILLKGEESLGFRNQNPPQPDTIVKRSLAIDASPYYKTTKYTLGSGQNIPVTINERVIHHPELLPDEFVSHGEGSVFIIRNQTGSYVLANEEFRTSIGFTLKHNPPRCFGFKPERIEDNTGLKLHQSQFVAETTFIADPSRLGDYSRVDIFEIKIDDLDESSSSGKYIEGTKEFVKPKLLTPGEVYNALRYGEIVDNISQASLFFALIKDGHLNLDSNHATEQLVFADFYDYPHQQHRLILPTSPTSIGRRIGGLGFSDAGKSWISSMTTTATIDDLDQLPDKNKLTALSLRETIDSLLAGKFDLETVAHLSRFFINHNLLTFSPSLTA